MTNHRRKDPGKTSKERGCEHKLRRRLNFRTEGGPVSCKEKRKKQRVGKRNLKKTGRQKQPPGGGVRQKT